MTIHPVAALVPGQTWYPRDGSGAGVQLTEIRCTGHGGWDYDVAYQVCSEVPARFHRKNVYFFQVQFFHPELEQQQPTLSEVQRRSIWSKP
jgi:hypothetical protein